MAIGIRQQAQGFTGIATTITVNFPINNVAHNLLIAAAYVNFSVASTATITDTQGNTWISARTITPPPAWDGAANVWYCLNSLPGPNNITVSNASTNLIQLQISEITGWTQGPVLTTEGNNSVVNNSPTCTTNGNAAFGDYCFAFMWVNPSLGPSLPVTYPFSSDNTFAIEQQQAGSFTIYTLSADLIVSVTGPVTASFNIGTNASAWGVYLLDFTDGGGMAGSLNIGPGTNTTSLRIMSGNPFRGLSY
jgi:hypothetical protein